MSKLFVVVRYGVYMQGIGGVFISKAKAEAAVERLKAKEPDGYHTFKVEPFVLDVVMPLVLSR